MLQSPFKTKKILWSIDAFEDKDSLQEKAARVISAFQNKTNVQIEPVFVLAATDLNWPVDYSTEWMGEFQENLRSHLEQALLSTGFPHVLTPKILVEPLASTSASIENLLDYAAREDADLIIVSSHGRKGLDRFFLGSFAETLLVHSHIPVLVIGANARAEAGMKHILFPTEFGEHAREAFRRTVSLATMLQASITIFHSVPMPSRIVMDTGYYPSMYGIEGEMITFDEFMKVQADHQATRAESWAQWARNEGVPCNFKVDASGQSIADLIAKEALGNANDLIVMEGQSGPIRAAILGSVTRDVVRAASCPVLVLPSDSLEKALQVENAKDSARFDLPASP